MQAACWIGRDAHAALGGVSAHLYAEFDGQAIDVARLEVALEGLYRAHPMLKLRIDGQGRQSIDETLRPNWSWRISAIWTVQPWSDAYWRDAASGATSAWT
ncbi:hypothetical protein [Pseudomonas mosselii]|uniref:hypothetical protein n=1 Tax=Pseudomonas mosselii TaxID=78327 RepID=UPI002022F1AA|nr:hypothetical protein [Pseudomonas mosselii]MCL8302061.1 hypothetical protein [Pseudomonas mosselii]